MMHYYTIISQKDAKETSPRFHSSAFGRIYCGRSTRVEWSRGTINCERINRKFTYKQKHHTEWYECRVVSIKPATTPRAFSLRSNMSFHPVSSLVVTGLIYISDRQLAGDLSRVEWSRGTTNCEPGKRRL